MPLLIGCGSGDGRRAIEGTVTVNGEPLADGYVRVFGAGSPSAGAPVQDGHFRIESERGLLPGAFQVEITSVRPTGRKVPDFGSGGMVDELVQFLPPRYNTATELKIEVTEDGDNEFQFDLTVPQARPGSGTTR